MQQGSSDLLQCALQLSNSFGYSTVLVAIANRKEFNDVAMT